MVLRAVKALTESGSAPSLRSLTAVVPAPAAQVVSVVRALDAQGYLDATRMRLTMRGLAAACASRVVTTDRRKAPRDRHWAGAIAGGAGNDSEESNDSRRPGLRKVAIVA
jgi:hypothetical protein